MQAHAFLLNSLSTLSLTWSVLIHRTLPLEPIDSSASIMSITAYFSAFLIDAAETDQWRPQNKQRKACHRRYAIVIYDLEAFSNLAWCHCGAGTIDSRRMSQIGPPKQTVFSSKLRTSTAGPHTFLTSWNMLYPWAPGSSSRNNKTTWFYLRRGS